MMLSRVFPLCLLPMIAVTGWIDTEYEEVAELTRQVREQYSRSLQVNSTVGVIGAANPEMICDAYMQGGTMDCECLREAKLDVYAKCKMLALRCTIDNSTCLETRFETIYRATADTTSWTKTCVTSYYGNDTSLTTSNCIEVQPDKVGHYNSSLLCKATVDDKTCNSCYQCSDSVSADVNSTISADCCNIKEDAHMTCGAVDSFGGMSVFISDPPGTHNGCTGAGNFVFHIGIFLATVMVSSMYMIWSS